MKVLWDTSKFHFSPSFIPSIPCCPLLSFLSSIKASSSSFLSKAHSWWWSSFFHGLFPSGWCLPSPLFLFPPLHLHGGKSQLKDLIEVQRSSLHRSSTSKLPSITFHVFKFFPSSSLHVDFFIVIHNQGHFGSSFELWSLSSFVSDSW